MKLATGKRIEKVARLLPLFCDKRGLILPWYLLHHLADEEQTITAPSLGGDGALERG